MAGRPDSARTAYSGGLQQKTLFQKWIRWQRSDHRPLSKKKSGRYGRGQRLIAENSRHFMWMSTFFTGQTLPSNPGGQAQQEENHPAFAIRRWMEGLWKDSQCEIVFVVYKENNNNITSNGGGSQDLRGVPPNEEMVEKYKINFALKFSEHIANIVFDEASSREWKKEWANEKGRMASCKRHQRDCTINNVEKQYRSELMWLFVSCNFNE